MACTHPHFLRIVPLVLAVACAPQVDVALEPAMVVSGTLERLDPSDRTSAWVGVETIDVLHDETRSDCSVELDLDAHPADAPDCANCSLTLDLLRSGLPEVDADCDEAVEEALVAFPEAVLGWRPEQDQPTGRVLLSTDGGESWQDYAGGLLSDDVLVYSRTIYLDGEYDSVPHFKPSGEEPRAEEPIVR